MGTRSRGGYECPENQQWAEEAKHEVRYITNPIVPPCLNRQVIRDRHVRANKHRRGYSPVRCIAIR